MHVTGHGGCTLSEIHICACSPILAPLFFSQTILLPNRRRASGQQALQTHSQRAMSQPVSPPHFSSNISFAKSLPHIECLAAWSANASAHSLSLIFLDLLPNILVVLFPYAYYRQLTVPTNPRTATTGAASAIPLNAYPEPRYTPLYNSSASIHHSATEERHLPAIPVSAQFSPGPPSFSRSPEGGYSLYDDNEGPEIDKSE